MNNPYPPNADETQAGLMTPTQVAALAATGAAKAAVIATSEAQASGSSTPVYGDLATVGPQVTVTVPAGGKSYAVIAKTDIIKNFSGYTGFVSFAVSGATTIAAGGAVAGTSPAGAGFTDSVTCLGVVALNEGSNTITVKYGNNGGPGVWNYFNRGILVVPLG